MSSPTLIPDDDEDSIWLCSPRNGAFLPKYSEQAISIDCDLSDRKEGKNWNERCIECGNYVTNDRGASFSRREGEACCVDRCCSSEQCYFCFSSQNQNESDKCRMHLDRVSTDKATSLRSSFVSLELCPEHIFRAVSADIVDVLFSMKFFLHVESIQESGCEALWVQSWDDDTAAIIGNIGGINRILDTMLQYLENPHIQRCGCEALQNLALNTRNRTLIVDLGGIGLIVRAMLRHLGSVNIQQSGCMALANIAISSDLHTDILQAGGGHAIVHALRNFSYEENICCHASKALKALGIHPQCCY